MRLRHASAFLVSLVLLGGPGLAMAQSEGGPRSAKSAVAPDSAEARNAVREGVRSLRDHSVQSRIIDGWGSIVGGALISGLGTWLIVDGVNDDSTSQILLGSAFGLAGTMNIGTGIFRLSNASATERTATVILANERELSTSGYLLLAHEAERARQERVIGGVLGIVSSVGSGLLLIPVLTDSSDRDFVGLSDTVWIALIAGSATFGLINGTLALLSKSPPEQIFEDVQSFISKVSTNVEVSPGLVSDPEGGLRPGLVLNARF